MSARRLLLVEDEAATAEVLGIYFGHRGFEVTVAGDADTALTRARDLEFDILLTDYLLPGTVTGIDVARELRERDPRLTVVLMTGYSEPMLRSRLGDLDDVTIVTKPVRPSVLLETINRALVA